MAMTLNDKHNACDKYIAYFKKSLLSERRFNIADKERINQNSWLPKFPRVIYAPFEVTAKSVNCPKELIGKKAYRFYMVENVVGTEPKEVLASCSIPATTCVIEQSKVDIDDSLSVLLFLAENEPEFLLPDMQLAMKKLSLVTKARAADSVEAFDAILTTDDAIKTLSYSRDSEFWKFCKVALRSVYRYLWPDAPLTKGAALLDQVGLFTQRKDWKDNQDSTQLVTLNTNPVVRQ